MQRNKQNDDAEIAFERSSGNVFADLGLENSDELLVKADLAHAVMSVVRRHEWTQFEAADRTGLTQPEVSLLHPRQNGGIGTLKVFELASWCSQMRRARVVAFSGGR